MLTAAAGIRIFFRGGAHFHSARHRRNIASSDAEDEDLIRGWFPSAHFVTIPDAGHLVHIDQPQTFVESVRMFLDGI